MKKNCERGDPWYSSQQISRGKKRKGEKTSIRRRGAVIVGLTRVETRMLSFSNQGR